MKGISAGWVGFYPTCIFHRRERRRRGKFKPLRRSVFAVKFLSEEDGKKFVGFMEITFHAKYTNIFCC
jgi:hypothetical protein